MQDKEEKQGKKEKKNAAKKYSPSEVYLKVIGSGADGAPHSLYVFTSHIRYFFNCGEGTQRLAHEHRVKLSKTEHIFITHKSWKNVGGLLGTLITLKTVGVTEVFLHGPPGVESIYYDAHNFVKFDGMKLAYSHYGDNGGLVGKDGMQLAVQLVPLWAKCGLDRSKCSKINYCQSDDRASHKTHEDGSCLVHPPPEVEATVSGAAGKLKASKRNKGYLDDVSPTVKRQKLDESMQCTNLAIAYICRPPPKEGHLLMEECLKAGVPLGPLLGQLKSGCDVTLDNGTVVRAKDVTCPSDPGAVFIVVEAPSEEYLDSLLDCEVFTPYQATAKNKTDVAEVVVHFTPSHVVENQRYQEWMSRFASSTFHLLINDKSTCLGSEATHRLQYKLNHLHSVVFPLLHDGSLPVRTSENQNGECLEVPRVIDHMKTQTNKCNISQDSDLVPPKERTCSETLNTENNEVEGTKLGRMEFLHNKMNNNNEMQSNCDPQKESIVCKAGSSNLIFQASTLLTFHIRPKLRLDRSLAVTIDPNAYIEECYTDQDTKQLIQDIKRKVMDTVQNPCSYSSRFPRITFLGTGSCMPSKTRNTSSILLHFSEEKAILMDCSEGTYSQMVRLLGHVKTSRLLQHLAAVYISHLHADHHLGLINIILQRRRAYKKSGVTQIPKLLILAPPRILKYLSSYHFNYEEILNDVSIIGNNKLLNINRQANETDYKCICDKLDMLNISVTYVPHCADSFGIAWSHRSGWKITYSGDTKPSQHLVDVGQDCDLLIHEATMEDGLEVDALSKSHSTVSQAIEIGKSMRAKHVILTHFSQRYSKVPILGENRPENVGIAFDNMEVSLPDLPMLHLLYPALIKIFADDYNLSQQRIAKFMARQEIS